MRGEDMFSVDRAPRYSADACAGAARLQEQTTADQYAALVDRAQRLLDGMFSVETTVELQPDRTSDARIVVCPELQGRVMTSTATGMGGLSFGWINRDLISSGGKRPHINAYGGEDRFWLGPEGGQFSIFFAKGDPQD